MSFGISGDDSRTEMIGADVVVAWVGQDGTASAVDYYLTGRVQVELHSERLRKCNIIHYSVVVVVGCALMT